MSSWVVVSVSFLPRRTNDACGDVDFETEYAVKLLKWAATCWKCEVNTHLETLRRPVAYMRDLHLRRRLNSRVTCKDWVLLDMFNLAILRELFEEVNVVSHHAGKSER